MGRVNARRRLLVVLSAGVLLALSAVLGTVALAKPGQGNKLTPQQRQEFIVGAKEVAGLNDAQIAAALKNPDAVDAIPVSFEVEDLGGPATTPSLQGERFRSAAAAACANVRGEANYRNVRGESLANFAVYREFCFNGAAITYLSPAQVGGGVTNLGASKGWSYQGVVDRKNQFFMYKGRSQGGHKTVRVASFKVCPEGASCFKKLPRVALYVHFDGFRYPIVRQ